MSRRRADWEDRLNALRDAVAARPFAWGSWDCARWGAAAVEAQTGIDFYAPFAGRYRSARGSVRALRRFGSGSLEATFTSALGEPVAPAFGGNGDIVLAVGDGEPGLRIAVVRANGWADAVGDDGLVSIPRASWLKVWKV